MAQPQRLDLSSARVGVPAPTGRTMHQRRLLAMLARQLPVDTQHAGTIPLPLSEDLIAKIGESTFQVYDALLQSRDLMGYTHASLGGIARKACAPVEETNQWPRKKLTERTARNALEKLVKFGLLENLGWTYKTVACAAKGCLEAGWGPAHEHKVFLRKVKGVIVVKPDTRDLFHLQVPRETADALKTAQAHGGARPGGGRPAGSKDVKPRRRFRDPSLDMPVESFKGPTPIAPLAGAIRPAPKNQEGRPIPSILSSSSVLRTSEEARPARSASSGKGKSPAPAKPLPQTSSEVAAAPKLGARPAPVAGGRFLDRPVSVGGMRLSGSGGGAAALAVGMPRTDELWVPSFPSTALVGAPRVPSPPLLDASYAPDEQAAIMARAYRTCVEARFGMKSMVLARVIRIQETKEFVELAKAIPLLLQNRIAPIAWAVWSMDVWKQYVRSDRPPPITWVFKAARIEKQLGWFLQDGGVGGGQSHVVPALRTLYVRYEQMRAAVVKGMDLVAAIEQHLPRTAYEQLIAAARTQVAAMQLEIDRNIQAGKFLW